MTRNLKKDIQRIEFAADQLTSERGASPDSWKFMQIKIQICQLSILARMCEIMEKTK